MKLATVPIGVVGLVSLRIYAANQEKKEEKHLLPSQLSVYSAPPTQSRYIEEQPGVLQLTFSSIRNTVRPYAAWCKNAYLSIENGICATVQFGKDSYIYLKNPPPEFLPKVGVLTVSGLAGLVLARKGSRFKKIAYPLGLITLGASVCYPAQTIIFAKVAGKKVYAASHWSYKTVGSLWHPKPPSGVSKPHEQTGVTEPRIERQLLEGKHDGAETATVVPENESDNTPVDITAASESISETPGITTENPLPLGTSESEAESSLTLPQDEVKGEKFKPDPQLVDHGQSNPEDMDMYSTRS
ncbi:MICOS complex subunit MIC27 [Ambystoma mexicanum]|uniref:MICOS complex subunit MIC27 n=1 Tax=Ambystoma mexicanum TaxID=8296 RepID=UPI0037E7A462